MVGGSRKGSANRPRERMLRNLENKFPGFDPICRIVELAELARADLVERVAERQDAIKQKLEDIPHRIPTADVNQVSQMYERAGKFLVPQLKAIELGVGGLKDAGPITVVFGDPDVNTSNND